VSVRTHKEIYASGQLDCVTPSSDMQVSAGRYIGRRFADQPDVIAQLCDMLDVPNPRQQQELDLQELAAG
jgi:hypothetical protein